MNSLNDIYNILASDSWQGMPYRRQFCEAAQHHFWSLLIIKGYKFNKNAIDDLKEYCGNPSNSYSKGFYPPEEKHYSLAVLCGNISFCNAYESYTGRKPFIVKLVNYGRDLRNFEGIHHISERKGRLVVGASFIWKDCKVRVTSFNDEENYLTACFYKIIKEPPWEKSVPSKRFKITNKDLLKNRRVKTDEAET